MTRAALWLSQQSAYAPDAFLREPERDLPFFLFPSDINTLDANKQTGLMPLDPAIAARYSCALLRPPLSTQRAVTKQ